MFIVEKKPKSIPAESYRVLRTNIQYSSIDKKIEKDIRLQVQSQEKVSQLHQVILHLHSHKMRKRFYL